MQMQLNEPCFFIVRTVELVIEFRRILKFLDTKPNFIIRMKEDLWQLNLELVSFWKN